MVGRWLPWLTVALALPASAAGAGVPTTQTCKPARLALSYVLPADWSCEGAPPYGNVMPGAKAGGMAPGFVVRLNIYTTKASVGAQPSEYGPRLAAAIQEQLRGAPDLRVSEAPTTVGASVPGVLIAVSYTGASVQGTGPMIYLDYFFIHGGTLYEFNYGGQAEWVRKDLKAIRASAGSIHFLNTA